MKLDRLLFAYSLLFSLVFLGSGFINDFSTATLLLTAFYLPVLLVLGLDLFGFLTHQAVEFPQTTKYHQSTLPHSSIKASSQNQAVFTRLKTFFLKQTKLFYLTFFLYLTAMGLLVSKAVSAQDNTFASPLPSTYNQSVKPKP